MKRNPAVGHIGLFFVLMCAAIPARPLSAQLDSSQIGCDGCLWRTEKSKIGTWTYSFDNSVGQPKMTLAESESLKATLKQISEIVHAAPSMVELHGVNVTVWARTDLGCPFNPLDCHWKPIGAWAAFIVDEHLLNVKTGARYVMNQESPRLHVAVNDPVEIYVYGGHRVGALFDADDNEIIGEPQKVGEVNGFTVYDNQLVVVASKPLFVPVSRERYIGAVIRGIRKQAAADGAPGWDMLLKELNDEFAAMSQEERKSQAYTGRENTPSGLVSPTGYAATPMVIFDPAFFDPALPRHAVQLITVRTTEPTVETDSLPDHFDYRGKTVWEMRKTIDYRKLAALLAPRSPAPQR